ncbi:pantoate--beta-alanine ligase [Pseudomonadota bacterium]
MQRAENRKQIHAVTEPWRREGLKIALVPTMGNLHRGHLSLVEAARREADRVVTSIYVNPAQFGEGEDYASYPRTLEADSLALEQAGCDLLFVPGHNTMYPSGLDHAVRLLASPDLAGVLEGESRPGHFDGVVTVVARLFNLVVPDVAVFGEKDYQQLLVIQRMADDLGYGIRIVPVPTVRETSGLAMSSRNNYLDKAERESAGRLNAILLHAAGQVRSGCENCIQVEQAAIARLKELGFRVDYVAVRRAEDLLMPGSGDPDLRVLAAVWSGPTRLIDNVRVIRVGISGH